MNDLIGDTSLSLEELIRNMRKEIEDKLSVCSHSDIGNLNGVLDKIPRIEILDMERENMFKSLEKHPFLEKNIYFYHEIEQDLENIQIPSVNELLKTILQEEYDRSNYIISNCGKRLSENNVNSYINDFSHILHHYTHISHVCRTALMKLDDKIMDCDSQDVFLAIKLQHKRFELEYPMRYYLRLLKSFVITKREDIFAIAFSKFRSDLTRTENTVVSIPKTNEELYIELERLSQIHNIEFDIQKHDGYHFYYVCDKQFSDNIQKELVFPQGERIINNFDKFETKDIINHLFTESIGINSALLKQFNHYISNNREEITSSIIDSSYRISRDFQMNYEWVLCWLKLSFSYNREIIAKIINILNRIDFFHEKFRENIDLSRLKYCTPIYSSMKEHILRILSKSLFKSTDEPNIGFLFESILKLEIQYLHSKLFLVESFFEISYHNNDSDISYHAIELINELPDLNFGPHKTFIPPFELEILKLKTMGKLIRTIMNVQIIHERQVQSLYEPLVLSNVIDDPITVSSCPVHPFEYFYSFKYISEIYSNANSIANDIAESLSINTMKYIGYFVYAIWEVFLSQFSISNIVPLSFLYPRSESNIKHDSFLNNNQVFQWKSIEEKAARLVFSDSIGGLTDLLLLNRIRNQIIEGYTFTNKYSEEYSSIVNNSEIFNIIEDIFISGSNMVLNDLNQDNLLVILAEQKLFNVSLYVTLRYNTMIKDYGYVKRICLISDDFNHITVKNEYENLEEKSDACLTKYTSLLIFSDWNRYKCQSISSLKYINFESIYKNNENLKPAICKLAAKIELANLIIHEKSYFSHHTFIEGLIESADDQTCFIDSDGSLLSAFLLPSAFSCFFMDSDTKTIQQLVQIVSIRFRLLKLSRIEYSLSFPRYTVFNQLYNDSFLCNIPYLSQISRELQKSNPKSLNDILIFFEECQRIYYYRMLLSIVDATNESYTDAFLNEIKSTSVGLRRFLNFSEPVDTSLKVLWKSIFRFGEIDKYGLSSRRYIPLWLDQVLFACGDGPRAMIVDHLRNVDDKISNALVSSRIKNIYQSPLPFLQSSVSLELFKCAFFLLNHNFDFLNIDSSNSFQLVQKMYFDIGNKALSKKFYEFSLNLITKGNSKYTKLNEVEGMLSIVKESIILISKEQQRKRIEAFYLENIKPVSSVLSSTSSILKPECYSKRILLGKQKSIYIIDPNDIIRQFGQEMKYSFSRLMFFLSDELNKSVSSCNGFMQYNLSDINRAFYKLSSVLYKLLSTNIDNIFHTWVSIIKNNIIQICIDHDIEDLITLYERFISSKFQSEMDIGFASRSRLDILKSNELISNIKRAKTEQKDFEKKSELEFNTYYSLILKDLKNQIDNYQNKFPVIHDDFFDTSLQILSSFLLNENKCWKPTPVVLSLSKDLSPNEKMASLINKLLEDIQKYRVINVLSRVGTAAFYSKKIKRAEKDRKNANATLWIGKRAFDETVQVIETDLSLAYNQLTKAEVDTEHLRKDLETQLKLNSQLTHFQLMTQMKEADLKSQIRALKENSEVNIADLLNRIDAADNELFALREENGELENTIDHLVREPMNRVDHFRRRIAQIKVDNSDTIVSNSIPPIEILAEDKLLFRLLGENNDLKKTNMELRKNIEELQSELNSMQKDTLSSVSKIFEPSPSSARQMRISQRIIKPKTVKSARKNTHTHTIK